MRHVHAAELRASWSAWASVALGFIATAFSLGLAAMIARAASLQWDLLKNTDGAGIRALAWFNLSVCSLVALPVVANGAALVVDSRRSAIARLLLAGAGPRQVARTVLLQLAATALASSVAGGSLVLIALPATWAYVCRCRHVPVTPLTVDLWPLVTTAAVCIVVALVGGFSEAHAATAIRPVDAFSRADGEDQHISRGQVVRRWITFCLLAVGIAGIAAMAHAAAHSPGGSPSETLLQAGALLIPLVVILLLQGAPVTIDRLVRVWTMLVPGWGSWRLARAAAVVRAPRVRRSVTSLVFAVGLLVGLMQVGDVFADAFNRSGHAPMNYSGVDSLLLGLGLPLLISVAGGLGSLLILAKQRRAEMKLAAIAGADPTQQLAVPLLEGVILTVTGTILGLLAACLTTAFLVTELGTFLPAARFVLPWSTLAGTVATGLVVTCAATTLPVARSAWRSPAARVDV